MDGTYSEGASGTTFDDDVEAFLNQRLSPLDRRVRATRFPTMSATKKTDLHVSLRELEGLIRAAWADDKGGLPWWKMARFGNVRTPLRPRLDGKGMTGNSLRHNANVQGVTGCEADYDRGEISFTEAERRLRQANIAALLYATPSSTTAAPRWRVIVLFSKELPPADRARFLARLNGIFDGALDPASFTLSQSFYGGNVRGKPEIRTALIDGRYLDRADDLDAGAVWPKGEDDRERPERSAEKTGYTFDQFADAVRAVENDDRFEDRSDWLRFGMSIFAETDGSEDGFALFDEWSQPHSSYDPDATREAWESFHDVRSTGWTVVYFALEDGWELPDSRVDPNDVFTDADVADQGDAKPSGGLAFEAVSAWGEAPPPRQWLVEGMIPHGDVTSLYGDGGTGKSLLAFQLAVSTATGRNWIGKDVQHQGTVLYLSAEDDRDELHRRAIGICGATAGLDRLKVLSLAGEDATLAAPDRRTGAMLPTPRYAALNDAMTAEQPTLVVLDTLADLHSGDQNDQMVGRQFIGLMRRLAFRYGCTIVLLAHPSKSGMANGTGDAGSVAWNNSVRSRLYFSRVLDKEGGEEDADVRTLVVRKTNHERVGGVVKLRWERGAFVNTEYFGEDAPDGEEPDAKAERVFLKLLDLYAVEGQPVSPKLSKTWAPTLFADDPRREGVTKVGFVAAMRRLLANKTLEIAEHGPPSKRRHSLRRVSDG